MLQTYRFKHPSPPQDLLKIRCDQKLRLRICQKHAGRGRRHFAGGRSRIVTVVCPVQQADQNAHGRNNYVSSASYLGGTLHIHGWKKMYFLRSQRVQLSFGFIQKNGVWTERSRNLTCLAFASARARFASFSWMNFSNFTT